MSDEDARITEYVKTLNDEQLDEYMERLDRDGAARGLAYMRAEEELWKREGADLLWEVECLQQDR